MSYRRCDPLFLKNQNKFIIELQNPVSRIRKRTHDRSAACCITSGNFLPYHSPHIIKTNCFTKLYYFGSNRNDFVTAIINRPGKLITYVNAQSTSTLYNAIAFIPNQIKIVNILLITVIKSYLVTTAIIFQLPIRWRSNDQMHRGVLNLLHFPRIARNYSMYCFHIHTAFLLLRTPYYDYVI